MLNLLKGVKDFYLLIGAPWLGRLKSSEEGFPGSKGTPFLKRFSYLTLFYSCPFEIQFHAPIQYPASILQKSHKLAVDFYKKNPYTRYEQRSIAQWDHSGHVIKCS